MPQPASPSQGQPTLALSTLLSAISTETRWAILRELAAGEQLMVAEIAERTGQSANTTSKHLAVLRAAGIVTVGRNRLYQIVPHFVADKEQRVLDFGWCLLRLNAAQRT